MSILAQDLDDLLKTANAHFDKEQYHTAAQYYQVAVGLRNDHPETTYRLAQSYKAIFNYSLAAYYYQRTIDLDEISYPLAPFYFAQMQKSMGHFKMARDGFEIFIKTNGTASLIPKKQRNDFIKQAKIEMEGCSWAIEELGKGWREIGFINLPGPVNSNSNDYAAVSTENDSVVTITSGRKGVRGGLVDNRFGEYFTDNFRYKNEGNIWTPENTSDHFERTNTKFSDGVGTYNSTEDKYYFTSCYEGNAFCKLYVTHYENGVWQNPMLLNDHVNAPGYDNKHPTITQGGDTLIFVSNRPGGPGGNDLWFSISKNGEAWEAPKLLPGDINTPFNEASPYCQGNLLFFSSDGHIGMGGIDIFMVEDYQNPNSKIQNLGTPFNSGFDDGFFSLGVGKGYLSSNRPNGHGKFDIYVFNIPNESTGFAAYLKESIEGTHLRSRIRSNNGSNLYAARDEDQFYYDNLTADERARLDRILAMKKQSEGDFDPKLLSKDDFRYYNKLDIATKATIERLAHRRVQELEGLVSGNYLTPQERLDWEFYQNIDEREKSVVDRIINTRVEGRRNAMARLSPEEQFYTLSSSNQERIENKVHLRTLESLKESFKEQHQAGVDKFNQNQRELSISPDSPEIPPVTAEIALRKSNEYLKLIEELGFSHQLHYQELSPEERDNLHHSAVRQYIIDNDQLTDGERENILAGLNLQSDPLNNLSNHFTTSQYQMSLDIRQVIQEKFKEYDNSQLIGKSADEYILLKDQLALELDTQQLMLQEQIKILGIKEADTRNLQQQLHQILDEQEKAFNPDLEQKIVDQLYDHSLRFLPLLTPKDSYYFNAINPGQMLRLHRLARLVDTQTQELAMITDPESSYITAITPADQWFYQELSQEDQAILDELVALGWKPDAPYTNQQQAFIDKLSGLERDRVNRMMRIPGKLDFKVQDSSRISSNAHQLNDPADPSDLAKDYPTLEHHDLEGPLQTAETAETAAIVGTVETAKTTKTAETAEIVKTAEVINYVWARIYFDFDRYKLRPEAKETLKELIEFLRQQERPVKLIIDGHTDNIGSIVHNDQLGKRRSLSAAEFFQPFPSPIVITTKSYGEDRPATQNENVIGRQFNRRVELKIQGIPYQSPLGAYLVKPNVTLSMIVETTGLLEEDILKWNGLQDQELEPYQPLRLPVDLDYKPIRNLLYYPKKYKSESTDGAYHTVQRGENLFRLAQRYHTTVQVLEDLNNIKATDLLAGQQIRVR